MTTCKIEACEKPVRTGGWCNAHYLRFLRHGDPLGGKAALYRNPTEAFAARTRHEGECIIWTGSRDGQGYGQLRIGDQLIKAHRFAWEQIRGPIPEGQYLDHICWNKACCRIEHLRLASHAENVRYQEGVRSDNSSGYRGVYRRGRTWVAHVTKDGITHRSYGFPTPEAAAEEAARLRAEHFGEFAGRGGSPHPGLTPDRIAMIRRTAQEGDPFMRGAAWILDQLNQPLPMAGASSSQEAR